MKHVSIHIGELYASREPAIIETVLGSCVAACLFDPVHQVGGMNHFLLPQPCGDDPILTRYGVHAMQALLDRVLKLGAARSHLRAKVFGAASVLILEETPLNVPRANERFVREFLAEASVPLLGERLGGQESLRVRMFTDSGRVQVRAGARSLVIPDEVQHYSQAFAERWKWLGEGALRK